MNQAFKWPAFGVLAAMAITTAMDATGLSAFSALPLAALFGLFWSLQRFSRKEIGFVWARIGHFGLALLHPLLVLGLAAGIAFIAGAINLEYTDWPKAWRNLALIAVSTILVATVTEEGFFRGWLWASLKRTGQDARRVVVWSSLAFGAWHLSAVLLETGFNPPLAQVPVFIINAVLLGAIWGMLRLISGSVFVASVAHGVWNGIDYAFFGFGKEVGALGIQQTSIYGPEIGVVGLVLNLVFAAVLWQRLK